MNTETEKLKKIFSLWRDIECLTPFEIHENDFESLLDPNNSAHSPRSSIFKWDEKNNRGRTAFQHELNKSSVGTDTAEHITVYTICAGVIPTELYVKRVEELLRKLRPDCSEFLKDYSYEQMRSNGRIALGGFRVNHFGKFVPDSIHISYAFAYLIELSRMVKDREKIADPVSQAVSVAISIQSRFWPELDTSISSAEDAQAELPDSKILYQMKCRRMKGAKTRDGKSRRIMQLNDLSPSLPIFDANIVDEIVKFLLKEAELDVPYEIWVAKQFQVSTQPAPMPFMNSPYVVEIERILALLKDNFASPEDILSKITYSILDDSPGPDRKDILTSPKAFADLANPKHFNLGRWPNLIQHYLVPLQQAAVEAICSCDDYSPVVSISGPPGTGKTEIVKELVADVVVRRAFVLSKIKKIGVEELFDDIAEGLALKSEFSEDFSIIVASNNNNAVENITKELPYSYGFERQTFYFPELADELNHTEGAWGLISAALGKGINWQRFYKTLFRRKTLDSNGTKVKKTYLEGYLLEQRDQEGGQVAVEKKWEEQRANFKKLLGETVSLLKQQDSIYKNQRKDLPESVSQKVQQRRSGLLDQIFADGLEDEDAQPISLFDFSTRGVKEINHEKRLYSTKEIDITRTELFLSALELHRLTILIHAKRFVRAIETCSLASMRNVSSVYRAQMLGTITFLVPVISTTFAASVIRFGCCTKKTLPWVVIDEASQASPQSALCLMQRAKRLIVIGDTRQLPPVVSLPLPIIEMLIGKDKYYERWISPYCSLQTLADNTQEYGTWFRNFSGGKEWTGLPLRVQRRSIRPMFRISNALSYSGQMSLPGHLEEKFKKGKFIRSFWLDVSPQSPSDSNCIPEEMEAASQLLDWLDNELGRTAFFNRDSEPKTLMICTPFRAVSGALKASGLTKNRMNFTIEKIGTIHTMQGRQADVVIFILGSRNGKAGYYARSWVCEPPNLLNVAVSRARETLIVIGNYEDWHSFMPMGTVIDALEQDGLGILTELPING